MNSIKDFITLAKSEYEALSEYCNALALLSHAINSHSSSSTTIPVDTASERLSTQSSLRRTNRNLKNQDMEASLIDYTRALKNLQTCHSNLKNSYATFMEAFGPTGDDPASRRTKLVTEHLQLSKRVLTTCASSSSAGFGPLHENGLLKNLMGNRDEKWHDIRVVSLVSLRASIHRLKKEFEEEEGIDK